MPTDSFTAALDELDPILRALVELSLRQGLDDAEIAGMLGRETEDVAREREAVLRELAASTAPHAKDADLPELEDAVRQAIAPVERPYEGEDRRETDKLGAYVLPSEIHEQRATEDREATRPRLHVVPEPEPEQPEWLTEPNYEPHELERKPKSRLKLLVPLLALVLVVAVVVGLQRSGGSDGSTPAPVAEPSEPAATPAPKATTALAPLPGAPKGITGTAAISDGQLTLDVTGLPDGDYGVWLYNSLIDSKPIGTGKGPQLTLKKKLPADADDYEFIDVSLEPADGNPNHSGQSVLRVPVTRVSR